jgi:hypothetical protein
MLGIRKEERPAARDRPAKTSAELVLMHRKLRAGQRVFAVERVVTEVRVHITAPLVGPAPSRNIDVPAKRPPELGLAA